MTAIADVVVYVLLDGATLTSWGRGTKKQAEQFVAEPSFPAQPDDVFVAVDDWGNGTIVAASPKVAAWVGWSKRQFQLNVTREPQRAARTA